MSRLNIKFYLYIVEFKYTLFYENIVRKYLLKKISKIQYIFALFFTIKAVESQTATI